MCRRRHPHCSYGYRVARALDSLFTLGAILVGIFIALFITDTIVTVLTIRKLNEKLTVINDMSARLRKESDAISNGLGRLTLLADEKITEQKQEFNEKSPPCPRREASGTARSAFGEVRRIPCVAGRPPCESTEVCRRPPCPVEQRYLKLQRHTQRRLLRAFPTMKNDRADEALRRLRAWMDEKEEKLMRRYVENVPSSLTQKELHDRAYALLYRVLKDEWGIASPVVEKTPLGKPYLKGGEHAPISALSHTKGIVCCAVSRKNVGIDAEYPRRVRGSAAERVCTPAELLDIQSSPNPAARFLAYWTLKESIAKCRGTGAFGIVPKLRDHLSERHAAS